MAAATCALIAQRQLGDSPLDDDSAYLVVDDQLKSARLAALLGGADDALVAEAAHRGRVTVAHVTFPASGTIPGASCVNSPPISRCALPLRRGTCMRAIRRERYAAAEYACCQRRARASVGASPSASWSEHERGLRAVSRRPQPLSCGSAQCATLMGASGWHGCALMQTLARAFIGSVHGGPWEVHDPPACPVTPRRR